MDIIEMVVTCPTADAACPYYDRETGRCKMPQMEESDPREECDAFFWDDDDEDEDL